MSGHEKENPPESECYPAGFVINKFALDATISGGRHKVGLGEQKAKYGSGDRLEVKWNECKRERQERITMLSDILILELRKLNRADKLRAMQVLVTELAAEEEPGLTPGMTYELLTPYGNEAAAQVLTDVLEAARAKDEKE